MQPAFGATMTVVKSRAAASADGHRSKVDVVRMAIQERSVGAMRRPQRYNLDRPLERYIV